MENKHSSLGFAVSMTLFTVFALFLVLVLLAGASSLESIAASAEERFSERTPLLYIAQKIRSADRADAVQITQIDGVSVLVLTDNSVQIYIYYYDGYLNELYTFGVPNLRLGTRLFAAESVSFEVVEKSLIKATVDDNSINVSLMSEVSE
ncbi:MAG: DUF4860 domain-containing protein [Oscillospiraceae bacterium]|nr:DUF4860 domain-containing protein [Oscillospiraceae bacterium]